MGRLLRPAAHFLFISLMALGACSESTPEEEIMDRLSFQAECWNAGDLECFMIPYWNSDSLMFIGAGGVTYGYENTLQRYRDTYPGKEAMGNLQFDIKHINPLGQGVYLVVGKYYLSREIGDLDGWFSLVWRKVGEDWVIVSDHPTASPDS